MTIQFVFSAFVPAIFTTIALCSWSDKYGRKFPILVSLVGFLILVVVYVIVINMDAPVPYLIIGHVLCGLCGDSSTLLACSFSHVTDITKPKERTFRITVIEACIGEYFYFIGLSHVGYELWRWYPNARYVMTSLTGCIFVLGTLHIDLSAIPFRNCRLRFIIIWWCMARQKGIRVTILVSVGTHCCRFYLHPIPA